MVAETRSPLDSVILDARLSAPLYVQLRESLEQMARREFQDGEMFFSDLELVQTLGVSRHTVRQALDELVRNGQLTRRRGQGTFVCHPTKRATSLQHIGAFIGGYESEYATGLLEALSRESARQGLQLHVYYTDDGSRLTDAYRRVQRSPEEEGLLFLACAHELNAPFTERGYHCVGLEPPADYHGASVETDPELAIELGLNHLLDLGHREIVLLLTETSASINVQKKAARFAELSKAYELPNATVVDCGVPASGAPRQAAYAAMDRVWAAETRPTAVMTISDFGAFGVLRWCAEHQVSVPGELSVLGFEGIRSGELVTPALTSVAHPIPQLAASLVSMLQSSSHAEIKLAPSLLVRSSTGAVRQSDLY